MVRVDYAPNGGITMTQSCQGGALLRSDILSSLLPFRNYTIHVHVMNAIGVSGPGSTVGAILSLSESLYSNTFTLKEMVCFNWALVTSVASQCLLHCGNL